MMMTTNDTWQPAAPPIAPVLTRDTIRQATQQQKRFAVLAPMVRCGTLPLRLLSMRYGASLVYTEELIAFKLRKCTRVVNTALRTVDFVLGNELVLRTCDAERNVCVVQLGVASPDVAVEAVRVM